MEDIRRGSTVHVPGVGEGVVSDMADGGALVRLSTGSVLDTTHGQWWPCEVLEVTGFDPDALVWYITRQIPARDLPSNTYRKDGK